MTQKKKIIVTTSSLNLWWGVYGLCPKIGWEDITLYDENGERIGKVCLNGRGYLEDGLDELKDDPEEKEFVEALEKYLDDNQVHFWYFYDEKTDADFYEVPYSAPKNDRGIKPRFMDIWHTDEGIDLSTIESGIKIWAKVHLNLDDCTVEIQDKKTFEETVKSFKESFREDEIKEVQFSEEVILSLCEEWKLSKEEVLSRLMRTIK